MVKNLPTSAETEVHSLHQEDPLKEKIATHSSILAGRIPWTEEPGGLQSTGSQRGRHNLAHDTLAHVKYATSSSSHCLVCDEK